MEVRPASGSRVFAGMRDWPEIDGTDRIWFGEERRERGRERVGVGKRGNKSKKLGSGG
jgi:hypothetical protein